jgi:hypothetical protein
MDRSIMEGDPHSVLEGMAIGAFAMSRGISPAGGYIYIRAEYPLAVENVREAIRQGEEPGVLGDNIMGSDFSFHIKMKEGAGTCAGIWYHSTSTRKHAGDAGRAPGHARWKRSPARRKSLTCWTRKYASAAGRASTPASSDRSSSCRQTRMTQSPDLVGDRAFFVSHRLSRGVGQVLVGG